MKVNADQEQPRRWQKSEESLTPAVKTGGETVMNRDRRLIPQDIPLWFVCFARHVLRCCGQPGVYHITLEVPPAEDQPREVHITQQRVLRLALCDNPEPPRIK